MSLKIFCLSACIILLKSSQVFSAQCFGGDITRGINLGLVNGNLGGLRIPKGIASGNCLGAPPNIPVGVSVSADNLFIDGYLDVVGTLPFQSAIIVEGAIPCGGYTQVAYGCGNGYVGIVNDGPLASGGPNLSAPMLLLNNNGVPGISGCGYNGYI